MAVVLIVNNNNNKKETYLIGNIAVTLLIAKAGLNIMARRKILAISGNQIFANHVTNSYTGLSL